MSWLYPEQWPGWTDHARVGGGLFDDAPSLVQTLTACWVHYATTSGISSRVALSPPPTVKIMFREDALRRPGWRPHFEYVQEWFRPELNGVALPFECQIAQDDASLPELRNFYFQLDSPQHQPLTCFFYLEQQPIGAMDLGQVNLLADRRKLSVHRRLGMTRGSDIETCYQASPLWAELPEEMQRDLRFLGWTFRFLESMGEPELAIEELAAMGFLEGGELLLSPDSRLRLGESYAFYQGLRNDRPDPTLRCHFLVVPKGVQPAAPRLEQVELFVHEGPGQVPFLEARVWLRSVPIKGEAHLHLDAPACTLRLTGGQPTGEGQLLFHGKHLLLEAPPPAGAQVTCRLEGTNRFGLSCSMRERRTLALRKAVPLKLLNSPVVSREQLQREWELRVEIDGQGIDFDLAALTLRLQGSAEHPPVQIPLASLSQNKLLFRYLPRSVGMQVPLEKLTESDVLRMWVDQKRSQERPIGKDEHWISQAGNQAEAPLAEIRVVDFDSRCRLLPEGTRLQLPAGEEIAVEGHRLQWVRGLEPLEDDEELAPHDLLLLESRKGHRRLLLSPHGDGQMQISAPHLSQPTEVKALWLSCGAEDHTVSSPKDRNPEGGPCHAFGLGIGQTQEMAQIRPALDGFRLYRHRPHVDVVCDGVRLPVEPHHQAEGMLLEQRKGQGWIQIDRALLRYRRPNPESPALELALIGYLFRRSAGAFGLQVTCGPGPKAPDAPELPWIHLPGEARSARLSFSLPGAHEAPTELLLQEHLDDALPRPLVFGERHHYGGFCLSVWKLLLHEADADGPPEPQLLLELQRAYGRKRFALTLSQGRLGYWREGSAFLTAASPMHPILAPDHPRQLPDGLAIPSGALVVGNDITQADLPLPRQLPLADPLPFAIAMTPRGRVLLTPLQSPVYPIDIHRHRDGKMELHDKAAFAPGHDITPVAKGRSLFRCGPLLFELSAADEDLREQPQAHFLLSIRGVCHPITGPLPLGGPHQTPLPILDPVPPFSPEGPMFTLYTPDLQLEIAGEGLVGLQTPEPSHSLLEQLQRDLQATPAFEAGEATAMGLLHGLLRSDDRGEAPRAEERPPLLHETRVQPGLFLTEGHHLDLESLRLRYHFRHRSDGHPKVDRVPAWLECRPMQLQVLGFGEGEGGFVHKDGTPLDALLLGRADPEVPEEQIEPGVSGELHLSEAFEEDGLCLAKLLVYGYAPRRAARITRSEGTVYLEIPAPQSPERYHITLDGEPVREALRVALEEDVDFHINHLLICRLMPKEGRLLFQLRGYLLGHQKDPAVPVGLGTQNRLGTIHLRACRERPKMALQTAVQSPHIRAALRPEGEGDDGSGHGSWQPQAAVELASGQSAGLVDLQAWKLPASLKLRPPQCDRLLWFFSDEDHSGFGFGESQATPQVEESSWAFGGGGYGEDEGSSFAFGPPSQDLSQTQPSGLPDGATDTQQELMASESSLPMLQVGWFGFPEAPAPGQQSHPLEQEARDHFGYYSQQEGPHALVYRDLRGVWMVMPGQQKVGPYHTPASISGESIVPLALWLRGRWVPLNEPRALPEECLLMCGPAAFRIFCEEGRARIQRRWLWLPSRRQVRIGGRAMAPESPTGALCLGLTESTQGALCELWSIQRGHQLRVKGDAIPPIVRTPDHEDEGGSA